MFILDTNVVSEFRKVRLGKSRVALWADDVIATDLYLSATTIIVSDDMHPCDAAASALYNDPHSQPAVSDPAG